MHYWTCITQYKLRALSGPSKNSQAKFKWMEADRHIFALMSVCGFQKASAVIWPAPNSYIPTPACSSHPSAGTYLPLRWAETQEMGTCSSFVSARWALAQPTYQPEGRGVRTKEEHRYSLGAASASSLFQTYINFGSLTSSSEKFLIFKAPRIFPALGPLTEKQTIFTFLLTLPFSGPQMDEKDHRASFLRCFQREARADTKNAGV